MNILEDNSVKCLEDDLFDRKPIVEMISNAINRKVSENHGCYVIGIYGKWGEGKSSVFEMVKSQLSVNQNSIIVVKEFNPWLFKDQESLLLEFFNVLADERIDKVLAKKIKKYAPIIALGVRGLRGGVQLATGISLTWIDKIAEKISSIGKGMPDSTTTVADRKKDISDTLRKTGKHLVVFIDDIDRLDKEETHALLKLVKQNADFDNMIYLLAMDVDIVAKAIGCRFGAGGEIDGYNFIEKIVQVPIVLPQIQSSHLKSLFKKHLVTIFSSLSPEYDHVAQDIAQSTDEIVEDLHELFETKREILRYVNQIQFILPSLLNEVSIYDLCLLEAIKLFHKSGYETIYTRRRIILKQDIDLNYILYKDNPNELKKIQEEQRDALLKEILAGCDKRKLPHIQKILKEHLLKSYFRSYTPPQKRQLCSRDYFEKYFIGHVPENKIPNRELYELANHVLESNHEENTNALDEIYEKYGWDETKRSVGFIIDLRNNDDIEKNATTKKLSMAVSSMKFMANETHRGKVYVDMFLVHSLLNNMFLPSTSASLREDAKRDEEVMCETCKIIISNAPINFISDFAATIYEYLSVSDDKKTEIVKTAIDRIIEEKGAGELLRVGQYNKMRLFAAWAESSKTEMNEFIEQKIAEPEFDIIQFLEGFFDPSNDRYMRKIFLHNQAIHDVIYAKIPDDQIDNIPAIQSFLKSYNFHMELSHRSEA
jgi:hypothetical protein